MRDGRVSADNVLGKFEASSKVEPEKAESAHGGSSPPTMITRPRCASAWEHQYHMYIDGRRGRRSLCGRGEYQGSVAKDSSTWPRSRTCPCLGQHCSKKSM